ncbi:lipopolysaccharide biosynthesis protein [Legionella gratiana]|uniref:Lipopolysaccharide biosynthesis protein n=1 Tax=Legionella gratiana TaxID=45066 RepID=A0A378J0T4_9GAMM|nr:O-antigen translocase [Legionella gratiana]KTD11589.1 lipopolysaccharide biosynthesis protein [Legionella gratiana]STX41205.1 lipopolysaccharide biosynthesis protein [Legionella gratiana]
MKIYNKLLKASAISGVSTLVKILTGIFSLKIIALYTGPEGIAIFGQFMGLVNIFATIAGGGITLGVIKYVAEYVNTQDFKEFLSTATFYTLFFSLLTMVVGLIYSQVLAKWILGSTEFTYLIRWLAIAQLFIAMNLLVYSIINGFGQIRLLMTITIMSSVLSLIMVGSAAVFSQLKGILFSFILAQALSLLVSLAFVYRKKWFLLLFSWSAKRKYWINLVRYSLMTTVSTLTMPLAQIIVRNDLDAQFGWNAVGYWQAVIRLSDAYILFVTSALTAYYLPRLSTLQTLDALKKEIVHAYRMLIPLVSAILILIYFCREIIISCLYSKTFAPATYLFAYQLIGDFFRVSSWLFTYLLLAKAWSKTYVITEVFLSLTFVCLSYPFSRIYGLIGVTYAFALTYVVYWLLMGGTVILYFKQENKNYKLVSL